MSELKKKFWVVCNFVTLLLLAIVFTVVGKYIVWHSLYEENQYNMSRVENGVSQSFVLSLKSPSLYEAAPTMIRVEDLGFHDAVVNYTENFSVDVDWFIDNIPDYIELELLADEVDFELGDNYVNIRVYSNSMYYLIEGMDTIRCKLTIVPAEIDAEGFSFDGGEYEYTGEEIELTVNGIDEAMISIEYEKYSVVDGVKTPVSKIVEVGQYFVKAKLTSKVPEYAIDLTLMADVFVVKKSINIDEYIELVSNVSIVYDGENHSVNLFEEYLPSGVVISEVVGVNANDTFKDVVRKEFEIRLVCSDEHYTCDDSILCVFEITPKPLTLTLLQTEFVYSGEEPILEWDTSVLEANDTLNISYTGLGVDVATYTLTITDIGNTNYEITNNAFDVEIVKADIEISESDFDGLSHIYDGSRHLPTFIGDLPAGITAKVEEKTCVNADNYSVSCAFSGFNANYNIPETFVINFSILPRPITACFVLPEDMIAGGESKIIDVEFDGYIAGEVPQYSGKYSGDTSNAGIYTFTVSLHNDNYILLGASSYDFVVYANELQLNKNEINIKVSGKFSPNSQIDVSDLTASPKIVHTIDMTNLSGLKVYKVDFENLAGGKSKVAIRTNNVCENSQYLKVYTRNTFGDWVELEYQIVGNNIVLNVCSGETLLFAEYKTPVERNLTWILVVVILFILASILTIIFSRLNVKHSRKI